MYPNEGPDRPRPDTAPAAVCKHEWRYGGIRYWLSDERLPGSGARWVYYYDWFYCCRCPATRKEQLEHKHDSYTKTVDGATPL